MDKSQADATVIQQSDGSVSEASRGIGHKLYAGIQSVYLQNNTASSGCLHKDGDSISLGKHCKITLKDIEKQLITVEGKTADGSYKNDFSGNHYETFGDHRIDCTWKKPYSYGRHSAKGKLHRYASAVFDSFGIVRGEHYYNESCPYSRRTNETQDSK